MVSFVHNFLKTYIGPLIVLPYDNSKGENPVLSCGASRYANKGSRYLSQSQGCSDDILFSIVSRFLIKSDKVRLSKGLINNGGWADVIFFRLWVLIIYKYYGNDTRYM